ncbi:MAG: type II toxin-antitoxin system HicA family toxin [Bacteroidales bacterium]
MGKYQKLLQAILSGRSDQNVAFADLFHLLERLGFDVRIKGSHHVFRKSGVEEKINLQKDGHQAKPYQVKQVRRVLTFYQLGLDDDE